MTLGAEQNWLRAVIKTKAGPVAILSPNQCISTQLRAYLSPNVDISEPDLGSDGGQAETEEVAGTAMMTAMSFL